MGRFKIAGIRPLKMTETAIGANVAQRLLFQ
jgi:hypothetical protein